MIMILTKEEVKEALRKYIKRDILGVGGQGFKGKVEVKYYTANEHGDVEFRAELKMEDSKDS